MINPIQFGVSFKGVEQPKSQDNFKGAMPVVSDVRGDYEKAVSNVEAVQKNTMQAVSSAVGNNLNLIA